MTETSTQSPPLEAVVADEHAALAEITSQVVAEINKGSLTFADLLKVVSPKQESEAPPAVLPTAKAITPKQAEAMEKVAAVYGRVVPVERRALESVEVSALVAEKQTLDEVKKMAATRLEDITLTVHNHLDVTLESFNVTEGLLLDGKGHYIVEGRAGAPDQDQEFSREVKNYAASLTLDGLQDAEREGLITHEQYLAMTRQVRVVDEARVMETLSKDPSVIKAIARATVPGRKGTSVSLRKRK